MKPATAALLTFAARMARFAPRLFRLRRRTWAALFIGFLLFVAAIVWSVFALLGWLWSQLGEALRGAPPVLRDTAQQAERTLPTEARRDVSGGDLGPVARYPGLARTRWQRDASAASVEYQGRADYHAVLDHYVRGFAAQGYAQTVDAASPTGERHRYRKGGDIVALSIERVEKGEVKVRLETHAPA